MFKLSEYWTPVRCNIVHLLQGKEVRSVYFVFVHTKSLLNPFAPEPPVTARADAGPFYPL